MTNESSFQNNTYIVHSYHFPKERERWNIRNKASGEKSDSEDEGIDLIFPHIFPWRTFYEYMSAHN